MGVALEVFRESQGLQERGLRYRPVAGIGEMGNERERGYELAVLGKVCLEGGRQFGTPQAPLEIRAPAQEVVMRCFVETKARHLI